VYARALFDIAEAPTGGGVTPEQVADELHAVQQALDGLAPELRGFFEMPQIRREDKQRVVSQAFEGKVSRPVFGLLHVLVDKRREALLGGIVAEFDVLMDERGNQVRAGVTSAKPLSQDVLDALQAALEQRTQRRVVLQQRLDPAVLGGIRVDVGDEVIDGTLRRRLADMRRLLAAAQ
jgi:F-type H+-transporting ATPase subunit delta